MINNETLAEQLIAQLADYAFTGFEEQENQLITYIPENEWTEDVKDIIRELHVQHTESIVEEENWNAVWESNFSPVVVDDFCAIRADFHEDMSQSVAHEIVITPKMSFGTGHHATTQMMLKLMKDVDFGQKQVLDFGTGTGVLAILAHQLGAHQVVAIDNDNWSVENAMENVLKNKAHSVSVSGDAIDKLSLENLFQVILANINRNVLLQYLPLLGKLTATKGVLLLSGILEEDVVSIQNAALQAGFILHKQLLQNNWMALRFTKE